MNTTLDTLFHIKRSNYVEFNGLTVHRMLPLKISGKHKFSLKRIKSISIPHQVIRFKAIKGVVNVHGQRMTDLIFWSETSPEYFEFEVEFKRDGELRIWNVWEDGGSIEAWTGNSGFLVYESEESIRVECSDGVGILDFTNLVIELKNG